MFGVGRVLLFKVLDHGDKSAVSLGLASGIVLNRPSRQLVSVRISTNEFA